MKRGFTLIETIISIALVSMLIVVVSGINTFSIRLHSKTSQRDRGFNMARGICEIFMSEDESYGDKYLGTSYKFINDIGEITSIKDVYDNGDGIDLDNEKINNNGKSFAVLLELSKVNINNETLDASQYIYRLRVSVYEKGRDSIPVTLSCVK